MIIFWVYYFFMTYKVVNNYFEKGFITRKPTIEPIFFSYFYHVIFHTYDPVVTFLIFLFIFSHFK